MLCIASVIRNAMAVSFFQVQIFHNFGFKWVHSLYYFKIYLIISYISNSAVLNVFSRFLYIKFRDHVWFIHLDSRLEVFQEGAWRTRVSGGYLG